MSSLREAAQQALEALEAALSDDLPYIVQCEDALKALRERLAQPDKHQDGRWCADLACQKCYSAEFRFKHTTPPRREWVGLGELDTLLDSSDFFRGARWAEAKLKEKNA